MKWSFILLLAFGVYLPVQARADFTANGPKDEFAVESNIEEIFKACLADIKDKKRKRIELYTCMNLGLKKEEAEKAEPKVEEPAAPAQ